MLEKPQRARWASRSWRPSAQLGNLDRVKRLDRIVNVTDIHLTKPHIDNERMLLEATCMVTTFRFLDEAERQKLLEEKKKKEGGKGA